MTTSMMGGFMMAGSAHASVEQDFINENTAAVKAVTSKYNLYASVQMAQAALESGWGQSGLSRDGNNFFGIKQTDTSQPTYWADTLEWDTDHWITIQAPFVQYASKQDSLEGNAKLLAYGLTWDPNFYSGTWKSNAATYEDAANSLTGKYATDPNYGQKLINIIQTYHLDALDNPSGDTGLHEPAPLPQSHPEGDPSATGYLEGADGNWYWFEKGQKYSGFKYYMGAYYYFRNGVRQDDQWISEWGNTYWVGDNGRTVQGNGVNIGGKIYDFGTDGTYYSRGAWEGIHDGKYYHEGSIYNGMVYSQSKRVYQYYADGVLQKNAWVKQYGLTYYANANGVIVSGLQTIDGVTYDFGSDDTYFSRGPLNGYIKDGSKYNGGYRWYDDGKLFSGFKYYMGTYYWFVDGVRQNAGWRYAWGLTYYTDDQGRAVQGHQVIDGKSYYFGDDGTYYLR